MLNKIYESLIADPLVKEKVGGRIKYYNYPANGDISGACVIIEPLDVPKPEVYADNSYLKEDHLYQIETWSKDLNETKAIAGRIQEIMWELNFRQVGGIDEWDKDFNIFRDGRRYRGILYKE